MELGLYTFAELTPDPVTGRSISPAKRLRNLIEEATLADEVGLDVFGIGEHHRPDFAVSAPAIALAAAAERTQRIRLTSAVSVLSSDDPVRVFQQFATLDLLSGGRAEIMAGRGSFIESFPLFGYDLADYDELFIEKLELLLQLREAEHVSWTGRHRAPLDRPPSTPSPPGSAPGLGRSRRQSRVGGTGGRARPADGARDHRRHAGEIRAVRRDPPPGGARAGPTRPAAQHQLARVHRRHVAGSGRHGVAPVRGDDDRIGRERGWPPMGRDQFEASRTLRGANFVGSPEEVVEKILFQHEIFAHDRFLLQLTVGSLDHARTLRAIELYGTEVAPAVRKELARRVAEPVAASAAEER